MNQRAFSLGALASLAFLLISPAQARSIRNETINVAVQPPGNRTRGPVTLDLTHVNNLRYDVTINGMVVYTSGLSIADLGLPFIPKLTATAGSVKVVEPVAPSTSGKKASSKAPTPHDYSPDFKTRVLIPLETLDGDWLTAKTALDRSIDTLNALREETVVFVKSTDSALTRDSGMHEIIRHASDLSQRIGLALSSEYPDIGPILLRTQGVRAEMELFLGQTDDAFQAWMKVNGTTSVRSAQTRIDALLSALGEVQRGGSTATTFAQHKSWLRGWKLQLDKLEQEDIGFFTLSTLEANCSFAFANTKETKFELVKRDRLGAADAAEIRQEIMTVECTAPFSVSGGFGISSIKEKDFNFVQSTKTVTDGTGNTTTQVINRFGYKNRSRFRPIPLLLLNTRIIDLDDEFALHVTAGAAVDLKSGDAGTDVEFVVGPSISFKRSFILTSGWHIGRVPKLAGGFEVGQEVPTGVDSPPIQKRWKSAFVLAFSYRIRG